MENKKITLESFNICYYTNKCIKNQRDNIQ